MVYRALVQWHDIELVETNMGSYLLSKLNKISVLLGTVALFTITPLRAQSSNTTNTRQLATLANSFRDQARQDRKYAENFVTAKKWESKGELPNHGLYEIQRIWQGTPLYYVTHNLNAARTVSSDLLWPGGRSGLELDGSGICIGLWDGAGVLTTHQEFNGRAQQIDKPSTLGYHATHIAGTLIAQGINANAKGMAPRATLDIYDWNSDLAEMAEAAEDGLLLSSHSYGYLAGWVYNYKNDGKWAWFGSPEVAATEDYLFGFYNDCCRQWDQVAYEAPYYLMVVAAGNERDDYGPVVGDSYWVRDQVSWTLSQIYRKPDGNFDCIAGPAVSKNVLTVGAIYDMANGYVQAGDVEMASFSGWGPTDDGRIKPDVVANGIDVYSTSSLGTTQYGLLSGTSMATPNATGSLALLQQLSYRLTGQYLRADVLKALVIHTADEAGPGLGPDYGYGWGVLNTSSAAQLVCLDQSEQYRMIAATLHQDERFQLLLQSDGHTPIKATITWTDPAGTPPLKSLDPPSPMLVNDLDLRLSRSADGYVYQPWKLDPVHPSLAASQMDNRIDNVEQILIPAPSAGLYSLSISHKGALQNGQQSFALICTGATLPAQPAYLQAKVWLQGAFSPVRQQMNSTLTRERILPLQAPYATPAQATSLSNDLVDWLLIELKTTTTSETVISKSVLLRTDGMMLDPATMSTSIPLSVPTGPYYIVIRHRNHLPAMSARPYYFSNGVLTFWDSSIAGLTMGQNGTALLAPMIYGLWAGDLNSDGQVTRSDSETWYGAASQAAYGYALADINLDGQVTTSDFTIFHHNVRLLARKGF
jgi:subtilisin family serine protease